MGEIADMMLEGDMCQVCGMWLDEGDGFPRTCKSCGGDASELDHDAEVRKPARTTIECEICGKLCRGEQGYRDHFRAKHGEPDG